MYSDNYDCYSECDDVEDGRQQLAEHDLFVYEQTCKARALLSLPAANALACSVAEDLTRLVLQHATTEGNTNLAYMLRDSIAEHIVTRTLQGREDLFEQPVTREGFIVIRKALDGACVAFEDLLQAGALDKN